MPPHHDELGRRRVVVVERAAVPAETAPPAEVTDRNPRDNEREHCDYEYRWSCHRAFPSPSTVPRTVAGRGHAYQRISLMSPSSDIMTWKSWKPNSLRKTASISAFER